MNKIHQQIMHTRTGKQASTLTRTHYSLEKARTGDNVILNIQQTAITASTHQAYNWQRHHHYQYGSSIALYSG